jgi:hypothetical protein
VSAINVSCASCLEVQTKACGCASPHDNEDAEEDAHFRERGGHREQASTEDC